MVFDNDLRFLCAGGDLLSIIGMTRGDLEGHTIFEVFPPEVSSALEGPYREALNGIDVTMDVEFEDLIFQHRIAPLRDDDDVIVAGIGFVLNVSAARNAERALRASERILRDERRRLRDAEDIGRAGSWEWDVATDVITWSDGLFQLHGLARQTFGDYRQAASRVHPDDRAAVDEAMEACRRGESVRIRYRVSRASDDQLRWFESRASGVLEDGVVVRLIGAVADITEQVLAEAEVVKTNAFLTAVLVASPDYTFITDVRTGAMVYGSKDRDLLGRNSRDTEQLAESVIATLVHPDDQEALRAMNTTAAGLADGEVLELRYRLQHSDGQWHWMSRHVVPFRRDAAGTVIEVLGVLRDVTTVVQAEDRLNHDALHDELTGLPNRSLLLDRLEEAVARSARDGREVAVLYCDLDGFKEVNDTAGHAAGDAVLIEVAARLRGALREGDTVARVGGDEFVIVIEPWNRPGADSARDVATARALSVEVADRVVRAMTRPFFVDEKAFAVTVSVGVTYAALTSTSSGADRAGDVIREADEAMYLAKNDGKNRIRVFGDDTNALVTAKR